MSLTCFTKGPSCIGGNQTTESEATTTSITTGGDLASSDSFSSSSHHSVRFNRKKVDVIVVGRNSEASKYVLELKDLISGSPLPVMGVATELITQSPGYYYFGVIPRKAEVLILSAGQRCVVFQLGKMAKEGSRLPDCIAEILTDKNIFLVGLDVETNQRILKGRLGVTCKINDLGKTCAWHTAKPCVLSWNYQQLGVQLPDINKYELPPHGLSFHFVAKWSDRYFNGHHIRAAAAAGFILVKLGENFFASYMSK